MLRPFTSPGLPLRVAVTFYLVAAAYLVATRTAEIGSDTFVYLQVYETIGGTPEYGRYELGFVVLSYLLSTLGFSSTLYLASLYAILIGLIIKAGRALHWNSSRSRSAVVLAGIVAVLHLWPPFHSAATVALRQGLAAPLLILAIINLSSRDYFRFTAFALLALSFHKSSLAFLSVAPIVILRPGTIRTIFSLVLVAYCFGLTRVLLQALLPGAHLLVSEYGVGADYRIGIRYDFAAFTAFWYFIPQIVARHISSTRVNVGQLCSVYAVLATPFFLLGWGAYADRFLMPAWLMAGLAVALLLVELPIRFVRSHASWLCILTASIVLLIVSLAP